jgi:hypothetical protein
VMGRGFDKNRDGKGWMVYLVTFEEDTFKHNI